MKRFLIITLTLLLIISCSGTAGYKKWLKDYQSFSTEFQTAVNKPDGTSATPAKIQQLFMTRDGFDQKAPEFFNLLKDKELEDFTRQYYEITAQINSIQIPGLQ